MLAILVHCASFCNLTCALGPAASHKGLRIACVTVQRESTQLTLDNDDDEEETAKGASPRVSGPASKTDKFVLDSSEPTEAPDGFNSDARMGA